MKRPARLECIPTGPGHVIIASQIETHFDIAAKRHRLTDPVGLCGLATVPTP